MNYTLKAVLLVSTALIATPVLAQQQPTPPEHYTLNSQGVDLVQGSFNYAATDVVIGAPGQGGLSFGRVWANGGWRDALAGTIEVTGSTYVVSFGAVSEIFTKSGSTFTPLTNNGSTLTQSGSALTFTASDGTVATYSTTYSGSTSLFQADGAALMSLVSPNGERLDYEWNGATYCTGYSGIDENGNPTGDCLQYRNAVRVEGIISNRGYALDFLYASDEPPSDGLQATWEWLRRTGVRAVNRAVDVCNVSPGGCSALTENWPSMSYNAGEFGGRVETTTDQSGRITTYSYDGNRLIGIQPPGATSNTVSITYDGAGKVSGVTDASGSWTYTYVDSGSTRTTTATGPLGQQMTVLSDLTTGRATSVTDALNQTIIYKYDSQRRLEKITAPEGDASTLVYDARGNVTSVISSPKTGSSLSNITTYASYPSSCTNVRTCNQPTTTTDARGNVTDYEYDPTHGGVTSVTAPAPTAVAARPQTRVNYAAQTAYFKGGAGVIIPSPTSIVLPTAVSSCASGSAPSCVGTASEVRTTLTYGSANVANNLLPTSVTQGDGAGTLTASTTTAYTPNGDVASVDGPLSGSADTLTYRYDDARRKIGVIGPDPDGAGALLRRAMRFTYDPLGAVTLAEQGTVTGLTDPNWAAFNILQQSAAAYDIYGRVQQQRLQAGGTTFSLTQTSYDAAGRIDCVAMRMNTASFTSPPGSACTAASPGSFGPDRIVRYGYDEVGRPNESTSGYGSGSPITEGATYSANGLLQTLIDGNGNVSTMVYDDFDRLSQLRYPNVTGGGSSTTDYQEYGYDAGSNVISHRNRAGIVFTATYDNLSRNTTLSASADFTPVDYTYDNLNRPLTAAIPTQTTTMAWDALGRMTSETGPLGSMAYQYDLAGRRTRQTWPDGFFVTNVWDLAGDMTAILYGTSSQIVAFSYDNLGRRTGVTRGNGVSTSYGYDGASRLISLAHDIAGTAADVTFGYTYNPANQIATKTTSNPSYVWTSAAATTNYDIDGLNRVTAVNGAPTSYGLNQQMTSDTVRTFNYDAAGRLLGVNGGTSTLNYDALGRVFDYVGTNGGTHIYDGNEVAGFAPVGTTTLQNRFIRGPGTDEIVANYNNAAVAVPTYYWLLDERNSTLSGTDGTTGVHAYINTYDEYGQPASSNLGRFQYTGQRWLPDFGLYDYKARAYNPMLGRFMQHDPIGYDAGPNLYAYVGGDPINLVDPSGTSWVSRTCSRSSRVGVSDPNSSGGLVWTTVEISYDCSFELPDDPFDLGEIVVNGSREVIHTARNNIDATLLWWTNNYCFVAGVEGVVGAVAEGKVGAHGLAAANASVDLTSIRYRLGARGDSLVSGFFVTQGVEASVEFGLHQVDNAGIELGLQRKREATLSPGVSNRLSGQQFGAAPNGFIGIQGGFAFVVGGKARIGFETGKC